MTSYVPNISGDLDPGRRQIDLATEEGIDAVMVAPMIARALELQPRWCAISPALRFSRIRRMGGAARIAPPLLLGKLFRLFGADVTIFPNHGGRFGYTPETCRASRTRRGGRWQLLQRTMPVPAGGMTLDRVPEILDFYGPETMLLIGGSLLLPRERLRRKPRASCAPLPRHFVRSRQWMTGANIRAARRTTIAGTASSCSPIRRRAARRSRRSRARCCFGARMLGCELRYFEMRRADIRRWSGTSICTRS